MPYSLVQFPDGYRVMSDDTGKYHSNDALPLARAKRQMTALNIALAREHDIPTAKGGAKTYRQKFLDAYDLPDEGHSLEEISEVTDVPLDILQEVYNRGVGAYKTNPTSVRLQRSYVKNVDAPMKAKLSKEQWGMARVYSFVMGNPKHDNDLRANVSGGSKEVVSFQSQLQKMGMSPSTYLAQVRQKAKAIGLKGRVEWSRDPDSKLEIKAPDGTIRRFGRTGYGDYLIWTFKEGRGDVPEGYAEQKRHTFRKSHGAIKGDWKDDPYSPNNLAIHLLW